MKLAFIIFLTAFSLPFIQAKPQQIIEWKNYKDYARVQCLLDMDTAILVGNESGLTSINKGNSSVTYFDANNSGFKGRNINSLARDDTGNIWITASCGLVKFDGVNWNIYNQQNSILTGFPWFVHGSKNSGRIWVGGNNILVKIDTSGWSLISNTSITNITSMTEDASGNLWIGTRLTGLWKWDGLIWTNYNSTNSPINNYVFSLAMDHNGKIWVANTMKLSSFDGMNWSSHIGPPTSGMRYISVDTSNVIWISTNWNGLYTFNGTFNPMPFNDSLSSMHVFCHLWDKMYVWVGTYEHGVDRVTIAGNNVFRFPLIPNIYPSEVLDIALDTVNNKNWFAGGGTLITTSGSQICSFNGTIWEFYHVLNTAIQNNYVTSIESDDNGYLWIGTIDTGLYLYDGILPVNYNISNSNLALNQVTSITKGNNNTLYIGFKDGTVQALQNMVFTTLIPGSTVNSSILKLKVDPYSTLWICTESSGLIKYTNVITNFFTTANSGLPSDHVNDITFDAGDHYWMSTNEGLADFDGVNNWTIYDTTNSALPENTVTAVSVATDGSIWAGTGSGIATLSGTLWTMNNSCNSPLPADGIYVIKTLKYGKTFIGTGYGLSIILMDVTPGGTRLPYSDGVNFFPNPVKDNVTFTFELPGVSAANLRIYNSVGKIIFEDNIKISSRKTRYTWNVTNSTTSGLYFYQLSGNFETRTGKIILLK